MVMFGHSGSNDVDFRYDTVHEGDLLNAVDKIEAHLQFVDQNTKKIPFRRRANTV